MILTKTIQHDSNNVQSVSLLTPEILQESEGAQYISFSKVFPHLFFPESFMLELCAHFLVGFP
jgi:hypothetical protein